MPEQGDCEQKGAVERNCPGLITAAPGVHPCCPGWRCGNLRGRSTVHLMREGRKGIVLFVFAHHNLSLIDSKLHLFPSVESVLLAVVVVYQSPCLYQHLSWNLALSLG